MSDVTAREQRSRLDRFFRISERGSTVGREMRGGLVTFVTMAYIIVLNPLILGSYSADDPSAAKDMTTLNVREQVLREATAPYNSVGDLQVQADFPVDGVPAGQNLALRFKPVTQGVWEMKLAKPVSALARGKLTVSVKDRQGNISRIERTFAVK